MQFLASFPFKMIQNFMMNSGINFLNTLLTPFRVKLHELYFGEPRENHIFINMKMAGALCLILLKTSGHDRD